MAATTCKNTISEAADSGLPSAPEANKWGCGETGSSAPITSKYVAVLTTTDGGAISVAAQNIKASDPNGKKVTLTPYSTVAADYTQGTNKAIKTWKCTYDGDKKYVPASCR